MRRNYFLLLILLLVGGCLNNVDYKVPEVESVDFDKAENQKKKMVLYAISSNVEMRDLLFSGEMKNTSDPYWNSSRQSGIAGTHKKMREAIEETLSRINGKYEYLRKDFWDMETSLTYDKKQDNYIRVNVSYNSRSDGLWMLFSVMTLALIPTYYEEDINVTIDVLDKKDKVLETYDEGSFDRGVYVWLPFVFFVSWDQVYHKIIEYKVQNLIKKVEEDGLLD